MHDDTGAPFLGRTDQQDSAHRSALSELLANQGIAAPRVYRVLAALAEGGWWSPRDLVHRTAVAHRAVRAVLDALAGDGEAEWDRTGTRVRLLRTGDYAGCARPEPADPVAHLAGGRTRAAAELDRLIAEAPAPRTDLDHVTATAGTALRRAVLLDSAFALDGARLLCVGDHDLTSLAATLVHPGLEAVVVDIDERMLAYIDAAAERLGLPVRCYFADLRLGLPPAVRESCDLAFTDPPYTPEGVELFLRRSLEGLTAPQRARVLLAYGASETTPALTARTQARLSALGLVTEALWPEFNRYLGAEAIGASADMYLLRPTGRTPQGTRGAAAKARVYSRGANAAEAGGALEEADARAVLQRAAADTAVGEWPRAALEPLPRTAEPAGPDGGEGDGGAADPRGAAAAPRTPRSVKLGTWLESPAEAGSAAVDLTGGWSDLLARAVLAAPDGAVAAVVPATHPQVRDQAGQRELAALLAPRFTVRFLRGIPGPRLTTVQATERTAGGGSGAAAGDAAEELLAHCQRRAHGRLAGTLREAMVRVAAAAGRTVNKRTARHAVAAAAPWLSGHTLLDLPAHRMPQLRAAAAELAEQAAGDRADPPGGPAATGT
ncbi:bis-aminopropyl spermidine synthase family protein [Streptomonospora sediminis]